MKLILPDMPNSTEQYQNKTIMVFGKEIQSWDEFKGYVSRIFERPVAEDENTKHIQEIMVRLYGECSGEVNIEGLHLIPLKQKIKEEIKEGRLEVLCEVKK